MSTSFNIERSWFASRQTTGMVVVGWLGRASTTLHCTHHALSHRLKVLSLFLFCVFLCVFFSFFVDLGPFVCRHVVCADEASVCQMMQPWMNVSKGTLWICASLNWLYVLAHPQFTAVYAESQDEKGERHDSTETLTARWETLQSNVTSFASRVEMVFATRS